MRARTLPRFISHAPDTRTSKELSDLIGDGALSMSSLPLLGMGRDVPDGVLRLSGGNASTSTWNAETSEAYFDRLRATMRRDRARARRQVRRQPDLVPQADRDRAPAGRRADGPPPGEGVCDPWGEVHGYPGLYIADGAALPGPVGANPSLTIAALADRMSTRLLETAGRVTRESGRGGGERHGERTGTRRGSPERTSLSFTEEMKGFYTDGENAPGPGEEAGREAGRVARVPAHDHGR